MNTNDAGTATPVGDDKTTTDAVLNGRIARATHVVLAEDGGLSEAAVDGVRLQTERLIQEVVAAYEQDVAGGEVGVGASAAASDARPRHLAKIEFETDYRPLVPGATGLLYGRIQSGKTAGMISFVAHALDNGFRTIIVLTSDNIALVDQTAERFTVVQGPRVVSSTATDRWVDDAPNIAKYLARRGLVVVCSKNVNHLERLNELLLKVGSPKHPTLILDDEADQASLDANTRKRKRSSTPSQVDPTRVSEEIQKIRMATPHNMFLQVTATPFAMFLQNAESPFRPSFTFLLEPGEGYTGGERFFSEEIFDAESDQPASPPLCLTDDDEPRALRDEPDVLPIGLKRSLVFFLVAASAREVMEGSAYRKGQNFLCHESHRVADHKAVAAIVRQFLDNFADALDSGDSVATKLLEWGYAELQRTIDVVPDFDDIRSDIEQRLPNREVIVVNAEGDTLKPRARVPNFIIGGNIVGRGLTIPNLLVTYYGRNPMVSQMDTMLQHARMFGYRERLMPFTRVFLPPSLAARFQAIYIAERELRDALRATPEGEHVAVQVIGKLRPTRHGVLDPGQVTTIRSGKHLYPSEPDLSMSDARQRAIAKLLRVEGVPDDWDDTKPSVKIEISLETFIELIKKFKVSEWNASALEAIARSICLDGRARLVARGMKRRTKYFSTGAVSGEELRLARTKPVPTFFVFRQKTEQERLEYKRFLYPTIVFPAGMPNLVFNDLTDA